MVDSKTKKIIAREGLIILAFVISALIVKNTTYNAINGSISNDYDLVQKLNIAIDSTI